MINEHGKIGATALAGALGVSKQSLVRHIRGGHTPLGIGAVKTGNRQTGEYQLEPESVRLYLRWLLVARKQVPYETIVQLQEELGD